MFWLGSGRWPSGHQAYLKGEGIPKAKWKQGKVVHSGPLLFHRPLIGHISLKWSPFIPLHFSKAIPSHFAVMKLVRSVLL